MIITQNILICVVCVTKLGLKYLYEPPPNKYCSIYWSRYLIKNLQYDKIHHYVYENAYPTPVLYLQCDTRGKEIRKRYPLIVVAQPLKKKKSQVRLFSCVIPRSVNVVCCLVVGLGCHCRFVVVILHHSDTYLPWG